MRIWQLVEKRVDEYLSKTGYLPKFAVLTPQNFQDFHDYGMLIYHGLDADYDLVTGQHRLSVVSAYSYKLKGQRVRIESALKKLTLEGSSGPLVLSHNLKRFLPYSLKWAGKRAY